MADQADIEQAMRQLFLANAGCSKQHLAGPYARHVIIHTAYKDNPYKHAMHLYNAGYRGRELNWGYLDG